MSLRLIYGVAGTGKTQYCFNEIKKTMNLNNKIYVIMPEQFSYSAERKLADVLKKDGIINVEIINFKRIAQRVFSEVGGEKEIVITEARKGNANIFYFSGAKEKIKVFGKFK